MQNATIHDVKRHYDGWQMAGVMLSYVHVGPDHWQVVAENYDTGKSDNPRGDDEGVTLAERVGNILRMWGIK